VSLRRLARTAIGIALLAALSACGPGGKIKLPFKWPGDHTGFDKDALESAIDNGFGGVGTCVVIIDAAGRQIYRYNSYGVCENKMPPCQTYEIAGDLIGLDAGVIDPTSKRKWDHTPQPVSSWQQDADLKTAFDDSIGWWQARIAQDLGRDTLRQDLHRLGYGDGDIGPSLTSFWMGPSQGGQLGISTRQQAEFLHRLYAGKLPVKPASAQAVERVMFEEHRANNTPGGTADISGKAGDCATLSDSSREVAWYVGRLRSGAHDWTFAASLEGDSKNALPGIELEHRVKTAFAQAGLWPQASG
jgi:beta-lactamase class D